MELISRHVQLFVAQDQTLHQPASNLDGKLLPRLLRPAYAHRFCLSVGLDDRGTTICNQLDVMFHDISLSKLCQLALAHLGIGTNVDARFDAVAR